jgi:UMF1 family MFS transporter
MDNSEIEPFSNKLKENKFNFETSRAWLFYDMGSSAYALSVGTLFFPLYFNEFAGHGNAQPSHFAIAVLLSTLLVGITAPILGAYADLKIKRNILFIITGLISVIGTALLPLTSEVPVWAAILIYAVVNTTFLLATNLYDSFLSLYGAQDKNYVRRSGLGWALGYLGGLICLVVILALLGFRVPSAQNDYWIVFVVSAAMYGAFSVYVFSKLPAEKEAPLIPRSTISAVINTIKGLKENRLFFSYLIGSILIVDGMTTVLYFMSIYASERLQFTTGQITLIFVIVQGVAIPGTWLLPLLVRFIKEVYLVVITCLGWMFLTALFALGPSYTGMLWIAAIGGLVVGSTPALLRAILGQLVAPENRAELFGFAALANRVGAIIGPLIYLITLRNFGITAAMFSSVPALFLGAIIFLIIGKKLPSEQNLK